MAIEKNLEIKINNLELSEYRLETDGVSNWGVTVRVYEKIEDAYTFCNVIYVESMKDLYTQLAELDNEEGE